MFNMMNNQDSMLNLESQTKGFDSTCEDEFQSESLVQNSLVLSQNSLNRFPYHLSYKFALKDQFELNSLKERLLSVAYNPRQKSFILIDSYGVMTWEWRKVTGKMKRVISYNYDHKAINNLIEILYCSTHNCYFALRADNTIILYNNNFEQVFKLPSRTGTILCLTYNPVTDELLTSTVNGLNVYNLKKNEKLRTLSNVSMAGWSIVHKQELNYTKDWIKRLEVDTINHHLYCCTDRSLLIYDFNGNLLRHYPNIHKLVVTCSVYSSTSKLLLTGSLDCDIKVWSIAGGLIETFRGHSRAVTRLLLSPFNSNFVLSSSLDGTVKMWSLDIMQMIYQFDASFKDISWMGLTESQHLYLATSMNVSIWKIPDFIDLWAPTNIGIRDLKLNVSARKKARVIVTGDENVIRIYKRDTATQLTAVLPIPVVRDSSQMLSVAYSRPNNSIYILIDNNELWIYFTKTNPATKASIWNVTEIQQTAEEDEITIENPKIQADYYQKEAKKKSVNYLIVEQMKKNHRAIDINIVSLRYLETAYSRCVEILDSPVVYWNIEGPCSPLTRSFLLIGLDNGYVLFCDPLVQNKKYFTLNCNKEPILKIKHDKPNNCIVTLARIGFLNMYHIQYWSLPDLNFELEHFCSISMTSFARMGENILVGYEDGALELTRLQVPKSKDSINKIPNEYEAGEMLKRPLKYEHKKKIISIDLCPKLRLYMSASADGCIKIWDEAKNLLAEILLDNTLSCCSFLNDRGDLALGWKSQIFQIKLNRVMPGIKNLEENLPDCEAQSGEEMSLSDDSIVLEETQKDDKFNEESMQPIKVDLNNYLHPFDIKLNRRGQFRLAKNVQESLKVEENMSVVEEKTGRLPTLPGGRERGSERGTSYADTLPESIRSTPRGNPLENLSKVDLTVSSKINREEIKETLIQLLTDFHTQEIEEFPNKWTGFPKFGESPSHTPGNITPPILSPRQVIEDIEEPVKKEPVEFIPRQAPIKKEIEVQTSSQGFKKPKKAKNKKQKKPQIEASSGVAIIEEKEEDVKLDVEEKKQEVQQKSSIEKTKQKVVEKPPKPVKTIGGETSSAKFASKAQSVSKPSKAEAQKPWAKQQAVNEKPKPAIKIVDEPNVQVRNNRKKEKKKVMISEVRIEIDPKKDEQLVKPKESVVSTVKTAPTQYRLDSRTQDVQPQPDKVQKAEADSKPILLKPGQIEKRLDQVHSIESLRDSTEIVKTDVPAEKNKIQEAKVESKTQDSKIEPVKTVEKASMPPIEPNKAQTGTDYVKTPKLDDVDIQDTEPSINIGESPSKKQPNVVPQSNMATRFTSSSMKADSNQFEKLVEDNRKAALLQYMYGMHGVPTRVRSAQYRLPIDPSIHSDQLDSQYFMPSNSRRGVEDMPPGKDQQFPSSVDEYFGKWLMDYTLKKAKNNETSERVRDNLHYLTSENMHRWLYSINKKLNVRPTSSYQSRQELSFSRGPVLNTALRARHESLKATRPASSAVPPPNSASTMVISKVPGGSTHPNFEQYNLTADEELIHIQPVYLVSQIEMEDIMNEVNMRVEILSKRTPAGGNEKSEERLIDSLINKTDNRRFVLRPSSTKNIQKSSQTPDTTNYDVSTYLNAESSEFHTKHRLSALQPSRQASSKYSSVSKYITDSEEESEPERRRKRKSSGKSSRPQTAWSSGIHQKRARSACSIPSKLRRFALVKYPQINLEYRLPNSPEKYLLPVRFPVLYDNIVKSIASIKANKYTIQMNKFNSQSGVMSANSLPKRAVHSLSAHIRQTN